MATRKISRDAVLSMAIASDREASAIATTPAPARTIEEIIEDERKAARAMERTQSFRGFTIAELRAAFEMVEDPENWKNPIKASVHQSLLGCVIVAIEHFAGSRTDVVGVDPDGRVRIEAAGYYMSVGA